MLTLTRMRKKYPLLVRGFNKINEEFKTYPNLKIPTEDLRNLGKRCLKLLMKFEIWPLFKVILTPTKSIFDPH